MSRFGRFEVSGVLGRGAHGVVYSATAPETGQEVAIKVLSAGRDANEVQRRRFQREVAALARLSHPGLMQVLDAGEAEGVPWFAMRKIEGETLGERLSEGPLPLEGVLDLGRQLCAALGAAHAAGILHRDVKPDNVLWVAEDGRYVLTDFGLAKDLEVLASIQLSREGAIQGTPGYWSPEQAAGRLDEVGPATDVYSLGATLYKALTGEAPIEAESFVEVVLATQNAQPAPCRRLRPEAPAWLERVLLRCLAKDPAQRFASLAELDAALAARGAEEWSARALLPQGVAALLTLGALGVGALGWSRVSAPPSSSEASASPSPSAAARGPWALPPQGAEVLSAWRGRLERYPDGPSDELRRGWRARLCAEGAARGAEPLPSLLARLKALAELRPADTYPRQDEAASALAGVVVDRVRELEAAGEVALGAQPLDLLQALARAGLQIPVLPAYLFLARINDERLFFGDQRVGIHEDYGRYIVALTRLGIPQVPSSYGRKARLAGLGLGARWLALVSLVARQGHTKLKIDYRREAADRRLAPRLRSYLLREAAYKGLGEFTEQGWRDCSRQLELAPLDPSAVGFALRWRLERTLRGRPAPAEVKELERLLERQRALLAPLDDPRLSILEEHFRDLLFSEEALRAIRGEPSQLDTAVQRYGQTRDEPVLKAQLAQRLEEWTAARPWLAEGK